jgi:pimeloyl-ACP methyl ester carboxylesterase
MAHQGTYGATQATWQPLIPALIEEGFTGMPFDFRGFGQSSGPGMIKRLDDDIRAAAEYLRSQHYDRIVCAGSCMGGTACLRAAIDGEPFIALIILASPFDASGGLVVSPEELGRLTQPRLFITGNQDVYGIAKDIKRMVEFSPEPRTLLTFEQSAHGTDLFQTMASEELIDAILNFLISLR